MSKEMSSTAGAQLQPVDFSTLQDERRALLLGLIAHMHEEIARRNRLEGEVICPEVLLAFEGDVEIARRAIANGATCNPFNAAPAETRIAIETAQCRMECARKDVDIQEMLDSLASIRKLFRNTLDTLIRFDDHTGTSDEDIIFFACAGLSSLFDPWECPEKREMRIMCKSHGMALLKTLRDEAADAGNGAAPQQGFADAMRAGLARGIAGQCPQ